MLSRPPVRCGCSRGARSCLAPLISVLLNRSGQWLVVRIDDEHGEQLCGLGLARVAAHGMARARRLVEAFTLAVDPLRPVIHLRFDFAGQDVAEDESRLGVDMRRRRPARRIVDDDGNQRLSGNVGDRLLEGRRDCLAHMHVLRHVLVLGEGRHRDGNNGRSPGGGEDGWDFHGGCSPLPSTGAHALVHKKAPRTYKNHVPQGMTKPLRLELDRSAKTPLAEQIRKGIGAAIESGVLAPGARLPSWQDLATKLGVARGTVRSAYERLSSAQLIVASRATGTHVADRPSFAVLRERAPDPGSFMEMYRELTAGPAIFQMGVPAQETFPAKLFSRLRTQAVRAEMSAPALYPDPRGELELRREIAAYLALARGIECMPSQIMITGGFSSGLGLALRVLSLDGKKAWVENPGFPFTRHGLALAGLSIEPIPVDAEGIDIGYGLKHAPDAALVVVTPGQQAPLGFALSLARRTR